MTHRHLAVALLLGATCATALASGQPDPSFGDDALVLVHADYAQPFGEDYANDVLIDNAGRYVTVGHARALGENFAVGLITRHLPSGQPDLSFNGTGSVHLETLTHGFKLRAVREQTDDYLLVGGQLVDRETEESIATVICRLDSLGAPDPAFGIGGCRILGTVGDRPGLHDNDGFADMTLQPDGRIVVLGRPKAPDPKDPRSYALVRLLSNGDDDTSFGDPADCPAPAPRCGIALSSPFLSDRMLPRALALDSDGRIVVAGDLHWSNLDHMLVHRFTAAGDYELGMQSLDFSELMGGESSHVLSAVHVSPDASVLVSGYVFFDDKYRIAVGRLDANGQRDATFGADGRAMYAFDAQQAYNTMGKSYLQSDGKLLVSGRSYPDKKCHVLRIDGESGILDTAFGNGGVATLDAVNVLSDDCYAEAVVADATRVLVAGTTFPLDGTDINPFLFRLDRDDLFRDGFDN